MAKSSTTDLARRTLDIIPLVMRVMSAEMRSSQHGVIANHVSTLGMLQFRPYTLTELADRHSVSSPTMSSTITTLEGRGWVKRDRDQQDRRVVWVSITPQGQQVLDDIQDKVVQRIAALLDDLSEADEARLIDGLTVLRDAFAAALNRDPAFRHDVE